jgi:glycerophosphoryl diester phosphodiesterase
MYFDARRPKIAAVVGLLLVGGSCNLRGPVQVPVFPDGGMLKGATPLPPASLAALQGRFDVKPGVDRFGPRVVTRQSPGKLSIFGANEAVYSILEAGCRDGGKTLVLEGYWRYAQSTDSGLVRLFVEPASAAAALCAGQPSAIDPALAGAFTLTGSTGVDDAAPTEPTALAYSGPLVDHVGKFMSISHHGTSTIQDYGTSENTVESFKLTEAMGADAVEIDVRLTKDGVPVLFHDAVLSAELVQGRFCRGAIEDLTFAQIRANCRTDRGQPIYSLEAALQGAMDETTLHGAWLDLKTANTVAPTLAVVARMEAYATAKKRVFFHVFGLDAQELVDAYVAAKPPADTRCLVEFDEAVALATKCIAWGPRFTEGPQPALVLDAQTKGLAVYFWTVDGVPFIDSYLTLSKPNGMITDTPGLAFYVYQENAWKPAGGKEPHGGRGPNGGKDP